LARSFFARYQVSTASPAPPPLVRLRASSTVTGAGTMTESPRFQLAGTETPLPSMVCKASKIRINSDCSGHAFLLVETWLAAGLRSVVSRRVF